MPAVFAFPFLILYSLVLSTPFHLDSILVLSVSKSVDSGLIRITLCLIYSLSFQINSSQDFASPFLIPYITVNTLPIQCVSNPVSTVPSLVRHIAYFPGLPVSFPLQYISYAFRSLSNLLNLIIRSHLYSTSNRMSTFPFPIK